MLRLSICVVVTECNGKYIDYLHTISPYFDELILITDSNEPCEVMIPNAEVRRVAKVSIDSINSIVSEIHGDWFLWLHEGEKLDEKSLYRLRDWLYSIEGSIGFTQVITTRREVVSHFRNCDAAVPRLLKKGIVFSYYSSYGELLDYTNIVDTTNLSLCGIKIYGSIKDFGVENEEKAVHKMIQELEQHALESNSPIGLYQYGYECYRWQNFSRAVQGLNKAIYLFAENHKVPDDYVYKLKYASLVELKKRDDETLKGLKLILQLYPTHTELLFYSALLHYRMNRFNQARQGLFACLTSGEQENRLCKIGVGSYLAAFYIGLCYEKEGDSRLATQYFQNALLINPSYKAANRALQKLNLITPEMTN